MTKKSKHEVRKQENKPKALETVRRVLEMAGLSPQPIEGTTGFTAAFEENGPRVTGVAYVFEEDSRFLFYMELHKRAPEKTRPQVTEFITRANFGLTIGNFELDYANGAVRFKTSIDYTGDELSADLVRNTILAAMDGVEAYAEALAEVLDGHKSPKQAVEEVEASMGIG
jgi:hypothetical protein